MARHIWSVLCRSAIIDQHTNNISLLNVVESMIFAPQQSVPEGKEWNMLSNEIFLVSFVVRSDVDEPEKCQLRIKAIAPDGTKHDAENMIDADLTEHVRSRSLLQLQGIPFWSSGIHWFTVDLKDGKRWKEVSRIPLNIIQKLREE